MAGILKDRQADFNGRRIAVVFGTRPEAIKMASVIDALRRHPHFDPLVIVTAQHRQMLDQNLQHFDLQPHHDLNIMQPRQTLTESTVRALSGLSTIFAAEKPDMVLVQGDTTSTFTGALAAFQNQIPVGHIEAGLRTFDPYSPFPEEMHRRLTGVLAHLHFAATPQARDNLLREAVDPETIFVTGNTTIDALLATVQPGYIFQDAALAQFVGEAKSSGQKLVLVEAHRRENWGQAMTSIWQSVADLVRQLPHIAVVAPIHRNPRVVEPATAALAGLPRVYQAEPMAYGEWANLMAQAHLILTDSGGLQEEAPSLGVPVLVLRENTERPEAVEAGTVKLVGTEPAHIKEAAIRLIDDSQAHGAMAQAANPFGDGRAADRIVAALAYRFGFATAAPEEFKPFKS